MSIHESTELLAAGIRKGDRQALAQFIDQKREALLAFIDRNMSDGLKRKVEPQDILQETTLAALEAVGQFELRDRDPFSWLCQVAERRIIDAHRKHIGAKKRSAERERPLHGGPNAEAGAELVDLLVNSMTTPSAAFSRDQREFRLQQAIGRLPPLSQDAIRMRYVDGLPTKVIALRLGKTDGSIRVLLSRTLKQLEDELGQDSWFRDGSRPKK